MYCHVPEPPSEMMLAIPVECITRLTPKILASWWNCFARFSKMKQPTARKAPMPIMETCNMSSHTRTLDQTNITINTTAERRANTITRHPFSLRPRIAFRISVWSVSSC